MQLCKKRRFQQFGELWPTVISVLFYCFCKKNCSGRPTFWHLQSTNSTNRIQTWQWADERLRLNTVPPKKSTVHCTVYLGVLTRSLVCWVSARISSIIFAPLWKWRSWWIRFRTTSRQWVENGTTVPVFHTSPRKDRMPCGRKTKKVRGKKKVAPRRRLIPD